MPKKIPVQLPAIERCGWRIGPWTRAVGLGRATYYTLPPDIKPESVDIGRSKIITESPSAWLARVKKMGGSPPMREFPQVRKDALLAARQRTQAKSVSGGA